MNDTESPADPPELDFEAVRAGLGDPERVLVDVLPARVFARGHLPGALNLPLEEIPGRVAEVLEDRAAELVVYCRNEH